MPNLIETPMSNEKINHALRNLTITWDDPKTSARDFQAISGLGYLNSIKSGKVSPPPIARLVGYRISEYMKPFQLDI